jgi:hypothetical protein
MTTGTFSYRDCGSEIACAVVRVIAGADEASRADRL